MRGALPSATLGPEVSEATEGVDDTNGLAELDERRRINVNQRSTVSQVKIITAQALLFNYIIHTLIHSKNENH